MKEILGFIALLFLVLAIIVLLGFIRMGYLYKDFKTYFIKNIKIYISIVLILLIIFKFIPRYEVGIDIIVNNNSNFAVINVNGIFYDIDKIETINNVNSRGGHIGIKTNNIAKIVMYNNEESIFPLNKKIKINITNDNIKIKSDLRMDMRMLTNNYNNYEEIINILNRNK